MAIYVQELGATMQFYALAFGLALQSVVHEDAEAAATVDLQHGRLVVCWIQREQLPKVADSWTEPVQGLSLQIEVDDVWCVVDRALEAGAVLGEKYETSRRRVVGVRDPDGVMIEISQAKLILSEAGPSIG